MTPSALGRVITLFLRDEPGPIVAAQVPDPDRIPRVAQATAYKDRLWYCMAAFIVLVSAFHWVGVLYRALLKRTPRPVSNRGTISLRRFPSALFNAFRALAFRQTFSVGKAYTLNISEVFLTTLYIVLIFTWSLVNSTNLKGQKFDPKYWANTAGNIAATQLPLMTALGTKNNILSFLTGVSFDKLNYLHRMTARVIVVLTWVHGAGRMKLGLVGSVAWYNPWMQCGLLASTSLSVLSLISIQPIRNRNYEVFLLFHFVLSFIFVLASYFHTEVLLGLGYYIWPTFLVWGIDRLLRGIRIVAFNYGYFRPGKSSEFDAHVEVLSPHFLRISLQRPSHFHWAPGQSVYLTMPGVSSFPLEAHPFTISTIDVRLPLADASHDDEKEAEQTPSSTAGSSITGTDIKQLLFLVRVRKGFSARLLSAAHDIKTFKAILDGPYSSPPVLRGYSTVVLIAGGSGVAFTMPLHLDLMHRAQLGEPYPNRVIFVWAIRELSHVKWISDALLASLQNIPASMTVDIRFFVTAVAEESQTWEDDSAEGDAEEKAAGGANPSRGLLSSPLVQTQQGRPNIDTLVQEEISQAIGPISISVCGTHTLANAVRSSLRSPRFMDVLRGGPTVTLHVEAFGNMVGNVSTSPVTDH